MPFTDEFQKVKRHFKYLYNDKAKAEMLAFQKAFELKLPILRGRKRKFKVQKLSSIFEL